MFLLNYFFVDERGKIAYKQIGGKYKIGINYLSIIVANWSNKFQDRRWEIEIC